MKCKHLKSICVAALFSTSFQFTVANASLITTIDAGATEHIFASSVIDASGPVSENGITWTATGSGYYGFDGRWGLQDNGYWIGMNLIGNNGRTGTMTITFDNLVSEVLAFVNTARGDASIAVYNVDDVILESYSLNNLGTAPVRNLGRNLGFSRDTAEIKSMTFTGDYIVANNLRSNIRDVPEPSTLAIFALGVLGLASRRFKKQS